ncbi:MAG TPA: hypothetical protein VFA68_01995 [Terriglobales bacterium]|nr:hypothetical protein [Terriglobales bacterium]
MPLRIVLACLLLTTFAPAQEMHHHMPGDGDVGEVRFDTSCSPHVADRFNHSVALLHSFQYEAARAAFAEVSSHDPGCAMAQWGIAMSHYHGLWNNGDMNAGRSAWQKAEETATANKQTTAREKAYIDAIGEIYREDSKDKYAHAQAFEKKMAELQAAYPNDTEAAIFHALTLDITAPKTDKTYANQQKCAEILEPIFAKLPMHPGVAHYLIHCYDNPALAEKGLNAARAYATIAPASAHANHMPSHIFTRVGSWEESINSNKESAQRAADDEARSHTGEARDQRLHALDYLEYAYLQSGQVGRAKSVLEQMNSLPPVHGLTLTGDYAMAAIPARYAIELGKWDEASALQVRTDAVPWAQAITWMAIGIGSARSGNLVRASEAERVLASLRDKARPMNEYWSKQIEVQRREVAAWIQEKNGKPTDAIANMRDVAALEESMDKDSVTPGAITPAREMLAELFALEKQPQEAQAEYEAVLKVAPNRFNALYGAATSAEAAGIGSAAGQYFKQLTEVALGNERPELVTARKKLSPQAQTGGRP